MPTILPIRDLRKTNEISDMAHEKQEPIFITKNGYSDLVVMSSELYDRLMKTQQTDRAIDKAEKNFENGAVPIDLDNAMERKDVIRFISARKATKRERKEYYDSQRNQRKQTDNRISEIHA